MELLTLLEEIGLTKQESRAYVSLYEMKEAKAGEISEKSKIATPNLYPVLESLIKKGLVSYKIANNIRIFYPVSIEIFNEMIKKKQEELNIQKDKVREAILHLKSPESNNKFMSDYKYFEGILGIKSLWNEVSSHMENFGKEAILKIYSAPKQKVENLRGFYNEFHKKRIKLKQGYHLIADKRDEEILKLRKDKNAEIRTTELKNEVAMGCFQDLFFITCQTGDKPNGFLIKDNRIAETFNQIFEQLWKSAKK
jgi:sugar-specific transcriptional regulator TrmB